MSYSYLVVHTNRGIVKSSVNPNEVFTEEAVGRVLDGLRESGAVVDGYEIREIDGASNVVPFRRPEKVPF